MTKGLFYILQLLLVDEKAELDIKVTKLFEFFSNPVFAGLLTRQQSLLKAQHSAMKAYSEILSTRISEF